jgi:hypothetical protein
VFAASHLRRPTLRDYGDRQEEVGNPCEQDDTCVFSAIYVIFYQCMWIIGDLVSTIADQPTYTGKLYKQYTHWPVHSTNYTRLLSHVYKRVKERSSAILLCS